MKWQEEMTAVHTTIAGIVDSMCDGGLRVPSKTHRAELADAVCAFDPRLNAAVLEALRLGEPLIVRRAVGEALNEMLESTPERFVGHLSPRELATLIVAVEWGGQCNSDNWDYLLSECQRATVDNNRARLQGILRKLREEGKPWPDLGENPAQPTLTPLPRIVVTPAPRRVDHAPVPGPSRSKYGMRRLYQ